MKTLYRTYRPQNFADIVNQNHVKITIQNEIASNRMAHAYIFCGPRGIGKTTIARIFSKSLNCKNRKDGEYEPCNKCDMCQDLMIGRSLDIIEIDAASYTGVDNVRDNIISVARLAPSKSKYKIFIIDEVHMLSPSAFNALLKLLEEPPSHAIFILCTTEVHKIPNTIISRTERFDFKRISASDIVKKLQYICSKEKIKIDLSILENIARQSGGHMRDAESLLGQVISIGGTNISAEKADLVIPHSDINEAIKLVDLLIKKDAGSAIGLVNKLLDDGISLKRFLSEFIELLRKIMLAKTDQSLAEKFGLELGENLELKITELGIKLSMDYLIVIIEKMLNVQKEIKDVFIEQLPMEIAITELCINENDKIKKNNFDFKENLFKKGEARTANISDSSFSKKNIPTQKTNQDLGLNSGSKKTKKEDFGESNLSKAEIDKKWFEVIAKIKQRNHSVFIILKASYPQKIENKQLYLAFKYKFHKDRIENAEIKQSLENILEEVYGQSIFIKAIVDETLKIEDNKTNDSRVDISDNKKESIKTKDIDNNLKNKEKMKDNTKNNTKTDEDMLQNVLQTFGGKVV